MVEAMERYLDEWQIRDKTYSAIAALASMGFLPRTKILMQYFHNIQSFLANLEHYFYQLQLVFLLTLPCVNTSEQSLIELNRVFGGRWARNAPYPPRLASPGIWLIRQRWQEAQVNPIRVLEDAFKFSSRLSWWTNLLLFFLICTAEIVMKQKFLIGDD